MGKHKEEQLLRKGTETQRHGDGHRDTEQIRTEHARGRETEAEVTVTTTCTHALSHTLIFHSTPYFWIVVQRHLYFYVLYSLFSTDVVVVVVVVHLLVFGSERPAELVKKIVGKIVFFLYVFSS